MSIKIQYMYIHLFNNVLILSFITISHGTLSHWHETIFSFWSDVLKMVSVWWYSYIKLLCLDKCSRVLLTQSISSFTYCFDFLMCPKSHDVWIEFWSGNHTKRSFKHNHCFSWVYIKSLSLILTSLCINQRIIVVFISLIYFRWRWTINTLYIRLGQDSIICLASQNDLVGGKFVLLNSSHALKLKNYLFSKCNRFLFNKLVVLSFYDTNYSCRTLI